MHLVGARRGHRSTSARHCIGRRPPVVVVADDVSLDSWRTTYPEQWTSEDVLNLIYSIAMQSRDIDLADFYGEKFQDVDGTQLCSMTERDFTDRDRKYGRLLYGWIKKFLIRSNSLQGGSENFS